MILIKNGFIIENNQLVKKDILIEENYIKKAVFITEKILKIVSLKRRLA